MNLEWEPSAEIELQKITCVTHAEDPERAHRLAQAVENAISRILRNPEAPSQFEPGFRKIRLKGFPFHLIYAIEDDMIRIIGFVHQSRHPDYWKRLS